MRSVHLFKSRVFVVELFVSTALRLGSQLSYHIPGKCCCRSGYTCTKKKKVSLNKVLKGIIQQIRRVIYILL